MAKKNENNDNNGGNGGGNMMSSLVKVALGVLLAVLLFMSYLLCEQRGWIPGNLSQEILGKVEDGKAINAEKEAKKQAAEAKQAELPKTTAKNADEARAQVAKEEAERRAREKAEAEAKAKAEAEAAANAENADGNADSSDESSDDGNDDAASSDDGNADSSDDSSDDAASSDDGNDDAASDEPAPATKTVKPKKKFDYNAVCAKICNKKNQWPSSLIITKAGTKVAVTGPNGQKVGETTIPVKTKVFIKSMTPTGVLTVQNAANKSQVFKIHASRTNFKKAYKQLTSGKRNLGGGSSSGGSNSSSDDDSGDDDSGDSDDDSDSDSGDDDSSSGGDDDDFFDDDF